MKDYGRKIIDYIFKKRIKRLAIRYELEQKVQADSDRRDIRVFETGIPSQQYGDNRQSKRNAEDEECQRLIRIAKEQGLYELKYFEPTRLHIPLFFPHTIFQQFIYFIFPHMIAADRRIMKNF